MKILRLLGCCLAVLGLFACGAQAPSDERILVGVAAPLSGPSSVIGEDVLAATQLAVETVNRRGGIRGVPVEILAVDDEAKPQTAVTVAQKLVNTEGLLGVIGHINSGCSLPASGLYHQAGLAMISPGTVKFQLTEQGFDNVFRLVGRDDTQGGEIARFIDGELKARRVVIVHDKTAYGEGLAKFVEQNLQELKVPVLAFEGINIGDKDFRALLTRLAALKPDTLFFGGLFTEAGLLASQTRQLGIKANYVTGAGSKEQGLIDILGKRTEQVYLSGLAEVDNQTFSRDYERTYRRPPGPFAPYAYDSMRILLDSIERAASSGLPDRRAVVAAVAKTGEFAGLGGPISFDAKGDPSRAPFEFFSIKAGRFVPYRTGSRP